MHFSEIMIQEPFSMFINNYSRHKFSCFGSNIKQVSTGIQGTSSGDSAMTYICALIKNDETCWRIWLYTIVHCTFSLLKHSSLTVRYVTF